MRQVVSFAVRNRIVPKCARLDGRFLPLAKKGVRTLRVHSCMSWIVFHHTTKAIHELHELHELHKNKIALRQK